MAKIKTMKVEVFADDEIATGISDVAYRFLPAGAVVEVPEAAAENLIAGRQARKAKPTTKITVNLAGKVEAMKVEIEKLQKANEEAAEDEDEE